MNTCKRSAFVAVVLVLTIGTVARSQEATNHPSEVDAVKYVGEVTGNHVYVRSGPDSNYYPVTQLDAGARVQIVDEEYGWLKIVPPAGCYSVIHKTYVDRGTGDLGVVNGNAVWVRTGSDLSPSKYAKQVKLNRGAEVRIIGEADEYFKITPPPGAHVYVSNAYVERVPEDRLAQVPAEGTRAPAETSDATTAEGTPGGPPATGEGAPKLAAATPTAPSVDYEALINNIEQQVDAEMAKPLTQQSFEPLIEQLRPIAESCPDDAYRLYASHRLEQLQHRQRTLRLYGGVRTGAKDLGDDLREFMEERASLRLAQPPPRPQFDVTGEFRKSMVFDSPMLPRRYLLVDPTTSPARTIAYLEIPKDSPINPNLYLGRYVGIVAAKRFYHQGAVEAIEVFVPSEIVILNETPQEVTEAETPPAGPPSSPANTPVRTEDTEPPTEVP